MCTHTHTHTHTRTHTQGNITQWRTESISKYQNCTPSKCPRIDIRAAFSWNVFPKDSEHSVTSAQSSGSHNSTWGVYSPSDHLCNIPSLPQGVVWGRQRRNGGFLGWDSSSLSLVSSVCAFVCVCVCLFFFFFLAINPHILLVSQAASIGNVLVWWGWTVCFLLFLTYIKPCSSPLFSF